MASNPPGQCCTVGVKHSDTPQGTLVKVAEKWDAYVATPPMDKSHKEVGILFCPDVMGIYENSCFLADQFAANGYLTMVVDLLNGDPVPLNSPHDFDLMKWMNEGGDGNNPHTIEAVDPIVEAAIDALKSYGLKRIGAVGYCFGAKYVIRHCKSGIDAGYIAHPSFIEEEELATTTIPLSIAAAETDPIFPTEMRYRSEQILKASGIPYQINLFSGVVHGFAMRADLTKRAERFSKEQSFHQAVAWFNEFLL